MKTNQSIKSYQLHNGETRFLFKMFVGVDASTGKKQFVVHRGFKTLKQAKLALNQHSLSLLNKSHREQI